MDMLKSIRYINYSIAGMAAPLLTTGIIFWGIRLTPIELFFVLGINIIYIAGLIEISTDIKNFLVPEYTWTDIGKRLKQEIRKKSK